jgi:drug/metabolite transporter (DMT)-like permease
MDDPRQLKSRDMQLRKRQIAGLVLLALGVLIVVLARSHHGDLFPRGWWRW